jgi:UDP-N-acetylglucosamine 2-epimerase (non-hydrolysing)
MKVLAVVGTRPEAIKMAPVVQRLRERPGVTTRLLATAQHREMLDQVLEEFGLAADFDLDLMVPRQALSSLTARCIEKLDPIVREEGPDVVVAEGDTTSVFAAALVAFYNRVPFAHVEAGLRTYDYANPFPEEFNRQIAGKLAALHFAPTEQARSNLLREGVRAEDVLVTGNTVIDALLGVAGERPRPAGPPRRVLVTAHRRENFGAPIRSICAGLAQALEAVPDLTLLWPVHPNPSVAEVVREAFGGHPRVTLTEPLGYGDFVRAMAAADFIVSDSGGVQEEAPALGKPVLVLREETERPEAVELGLSRLIGSDTDRVAAEVRRLACDPEAFAAMARGGSPYGDGKAAIRIADALVERFGGAPLAPGARAG